MSTEKLPSIQPDATRTIQVTEARGIAERAISKQTMDNANGDTCAEFFWFWWFGKFESRIKAPEDLSADAGLSSVR